MRRVHSSWIIAFASVGIVIGVVIAREISIFSSIAWLLTGTGFILTAILGGRAWLVIAAIAGGMIIGLWRGSGEAINLGVYEQYLGTEQTITGIVKEDIDTNQRQQSVLRLRNIVIEGRPLTGSMWVTTYSRIDIRRSDVVTLKGKVNEGFGSFAASMYGADIVRVQRTEPGDVALKVRDRFASGVERALEDTQASLGLGYLVGQRRGLPDELDAALVAAGLTHIVVASGYNLTILVRLARRLFENVSKYLSFISAGGMILAFIAVTGLSPSMSRAGLVAGLSLVAWYYGRRFHPLVLLPFAMAITLLVQPSYVWGDLGWQLSFAAFAGVMILAPLIEAYLFADKPERQLRRIFIETMSATIATLPILIVSFGQVSIVAPIANIVILPLVPLAMLLTFIAGTGGLLLPAIATVIGFPAQILLTYMTESATFFGALPWAIQEVEVEPYAALILYVIVALAAIYMHYKTKYDLQSSSIIE